MVIKAVLFDLGGTLIRTLPINQLFREILAAHGIKRSAEEIAQARSNAEKNVNFERYPFLGNKFWSKWNTRILEQLNIHDNVPYLAERITKEWWQYSEVELYPDAERALGKLKLNGLKIGLVTNGLKDDIKEVLPRIGLIGFFDVEVASDTVRKMKPNREIFLHALEELKVLPNEAIFVGDMVEQDYKGAKKCGLKTFLIDREKKVKEENVEKITSLIEMLEYV